MKIIPVTPRGYCKGVIYAIELAKQTRKNNPDKKITMLGMIVHNKHIINACKEIGIDCVESKGKTRLELLDEINDGIVIFTAHGVSDDVIKKATEKGLKIVDASCNDVVKTKNIVKNHINEGYNVIYIGKKHHPEAEAITSISSKVHLVSNINDLKKLDHFDKSMLTNQTTMSILEINDIIQQAKIMYPNIIIWEEICSATRIRQQAIKDLKDVDTLIVVGDKTSNNSNKLIEVGKDNNIKNAYLVENVSELKSSWFKDSKTVAVTSGASTPTLITQQVIDALNYYSVHEKFCSDTIILDKLI
ncbi:MAG: 4-hydroxy-3-methylbut-2-enyl diphosphate reductase [Anaerorhabdus sp.]